MKRVIALILTAMMLLTAVLLTGCGDDKNKTQAAAVEAPEGAIANTNPSGVVTSFYKNEYSDDGKLLRYYDYNSKGELLGSTAYEYDQYGNDIKTILYGRDNEIQAQIKYEKTPEGMITKRTDIDANGVITQIVTIEYTDFNAEKTISNYNGDGTLKSYKENEYDSNQNLTKTTNYDADGNVKHYTTYVTDEKGVTTKYKYDAEGNLITE